MMQNYQQKDFQQNIENSEVSGKMAEVAKLREEIAEMRKQLAEKKSEKAPEKRMPAEKEPEIFIESAPEGATNAEQAEPAGINQAPQSTVQSNQSAQMNSQIKILCDLAFQKGVEAALKAAQELNNPYILDELHDILVDELYERLIKEKKIERE